MSNSTFFDKLAEQWDDSRMPDNKKITQLVELIGLRRGDKVLDAGCGTGVLLPFVKNAIGQEGFITALDYSPKMIARAAAKFSGLGGINFLVCDIMEYESASLYDAVICFNFFPHIQDRTGFFRCISDLLAQGGSLIIMHDISRETVNGVHQSCEAVENDLLPPGETVKKVLLEAGFAVELVIDGNDRYFVKAVKNGVI
jgi:demethylmenaquinone methyltransferase/2-methoxy-6-polyprenyl-1,4-benzoquinol methylase